MTKVKSLKDYKLEYEDMRMKMSKKIAKSKLEVAKAFVITKFNQVKDKVMGVVNKTITPKKTVRKLTKAQQKEHRDQQKRAIMGIGLLFVIVSIGYSTAVTTYFVDGFAPLVALAPQVIFGAIILLKAFSKLYK